MVVVGQQSQFSHKLQNYIILTKKHGMLQLKSVVRIRCDLSMTVHKYNSPTVEKLQKISIQAGHQGEGCRVLATKTKRQFHLYLDDNIFNLCNPYSELMFSLKLWVVTVSREIGLCVLGVLLYTVYFIHKTKRSAVTRLTDMKITLAFLLTPLRLSPLFFSLAKPMFY